jgi:DNA-binding IclR family transcriptional regulator
MIIQSIQRAIDILSLFSHSRPRWGITEIASATGLAKGTVHNIVHTLTQGGFLMRNPETRRYTLGYRTFTLGAIMAGTLEINQKAAGLAQQLAGRTGLISRLAIWDQDAALVTLNVWPHHADSLAQQIGPRVVAYCSALGRALLAHLETDKILAYLDQVEMVRFTPQTVTDPAQLLDILAETRNRGYAINNQELAPKQASIAATIFQSNSRPAASICLSGTSERILGDDMENLVTDLRRTATEISRYMGYFPSVPGQNRPRQAGEGPHDGSGTGVLER